MWEDQEPPKKAPEKNNLDRMGVAELNAYVAELEMEIARAKAAIAQKQAIRSGAEGLFKR